MIQEIKCALLLPPVLALAHHVPDVSLERFRDNVITRLSEPHSVVITEKHEGVIRAFVFCTVDRFQGADAFVIQYAYCDPKAFNAGAEVFARACQIAKSLALENIFMMTSRNPEGFIRKYKFEHFRYVLKRRV